MAFAVESVEPAVKAIVIIRGHRGSGKATVAGHLVALFDAVRIRSDVERFLMVNAT